MTRRRFYAPPSAFSADNQTITLTPEETRHLRDVVRLAEDDEVYVFDGAGHEFQCTIKTIGRESVVSVVAEIAATCPESPLDLTLAVALLKGEKFDLVVQKTTELGVVRIQPIVTQRVEARLRHEEAHHKRVARWQRIAVEAAKQSGRARVPKINEPIIFQELLESFSEDAGSGNADRHLMFSERGGDSFAQTIETWPTPPSSIVAVIGPEGGWDDQDIGLALAAGWKMVTLGGRILRAETAAITIAALLQHRFGDLI